MFVRDGQRAFRVLARIASSRWLRKQARSDPRLEEIGPGPRPRLSRGGGSPSTHRAAGSFLTTLFSDGFHPRPFKHSQSTQVLMVKVGGRRAVAAARHLYYDGSSMRSHASWRSRANALVGTASVEQVPWQIWADGREWSLARGSDYQKAGRVWEAGRQFARRHGLRFELRDLGDSLKLRFSPR